MDGVMHDFMKVDYVIILKLEFSVKYNCDDTYIYII